MVLVGRTNYNAINGLINRGLRISFPISNNHCGSLSESRLEPLFIASHSSRNKVETGGYILLFSDVHKKGHLYYA